MKRLLIPLLLLMLLLLQGCQNAETPAVDTVNLPQPSTPDVIPGNPTPVKNGGDRTSPERFTVEFTASPETAFPDAIEVIYEDEHFSYGLSCISSEYYFIVFDDGMHVPLVEALTTGQVSIEDCIANGLSVYKQLRQPDNSDNPVYLDVRGSCYSLQMEYIPYTIVNNSGKRIDVLLIPSLERLGGERWIGIPTVGVEFCGVADPIDTSLDGELPLLWYDGSLTAGYYRLSFEVRGGENDAVATILSDTFEIS